jgi:DNA-binding CsgD family transcriptional regulator
MADKLLKTYRGAAKVMGPERTELTRRQREVMQLLAEGKTAAEAAEVLHLSPRTVEFHKYRIMELLGIKTNAGLVRHAIEIGLIQGDSTEAASMN